MSEKLGKIQTKTVIEFAYNELIKQCQFWQGNKRLYIRGPKVIIIAMMKFIIDDENLTSLGFTTDGGLTLMSLSVSEE